MNNVAHGISFFIDLGLSGWTHEPERAADRPLGAHVRQPVARVKLEHFGIESKNERDRGGDRIKANR